MALKLSDLERAFWKLTDRGGIRRAARLVYDMVKGGSAGQVLSKVSGTDYDFLWTTASGGGKRGMVFGLGKNAGITTGKIKGYFTIDYSGTISGWSLSQLGGTSVTVKIWKLADGAALPTAANSINTSGISLTNPHIRSTTLTDFTTTTVTAGDIFAVEITAVTGTITDFAGTLEITP